MNRARQAEVLAAVAAAGAAFALLRLALAGTWPSLIRESLPRPILAKLNPAWPAWKRRNSFQMRYSIHK